MAAIAEGQRTVIRRDDDRQRAGPRASRRAASRRRPAADVAFVIGDRTAELDTLRTLLVVLLGGGLAVLAASLVVGSVYAGRALVPIRESLAPPARVRGRRLATSSGRRSRSPGRRSRSCGAAGPTRRRSTGRSTTSTRAPRGMESPRRRPAAARPDRRRRRRARDGRHGPRATPRPRRLESLEPVAASARRAAGAGRRARARPRRRGAAAPAGRRSSSTTRSATRPAGGRVTVTVRPGARLTRRGRGAGIDAGAPRAGVRAVLAGARRAERRHRPGPRDRALDRRAPRRADPAPSGASRARGARFVVRLAGRLTPRRARPVRCRRDGRTRSSPIARRAHVRSSRRDADRASLRPRGSATRRGRSLLVHGTTADHRTWRVLGPMLAPRHASTPSTGAAAATRATARAYVDRARARGPRRRRRRARRGDRRTRRRAGSLAGRADRPRRVAPDAVDPAVIAYESAPGSARRAPGAATTSSSTRSATTSPAATTTRSSPGS